MNKAALSIGVLLAIITGCTTVKVENTGTDIRQEPAKVIKTGVTTKEEVLKAFGEPSRISTKDGAEELVYESQKTETPSYLGGLVINEAGRNMTVKRLEIVIQNGVVQSYRFEARGE